MSHQHNSAFQMPYMQCKYLLMVAIILFGVFIVISSVYITDCKASEESAMMTPKQMQMDLRFIRDTIVKNHANPYHSISKAEYDMLFSRLTDKVKKPMRPAAFYFIANSLVMPLSDAHTRLNYEYTTMRLPIYFNWLPDGAVIVGFRSRSGLSNETIKALSKSRIVAINGVSMDVLQDRLSAVIPNENKIEVRIMGSDLLKCDYFWKYFLGRSAVDKVRVTVEKNGRIRRFNLPFVSYKDESASASYKPTLFETKYFDAQSVAYIQIWRCDDSKEFLGEMNEFMGNVVQNKYRALIIDLRDNGGGSTDIIMDFLKYMPGDAFLWYKGYSSKNIYQKYMAKDARSIRSASAEAAWWKKPYDARDIPVFKGKIYILINSGTFSSANGFAVAFKDNGLATIVGQRTSNAPCNYGAFDTYSLPYGRFSLQVSNTYFNRPSGLCDTNTLIPDVEIPLTVADVVRGGDPVLKWIENKFEIQFNRTDFH